MFSPRFDENLRQALGKLFVSMPDVTSGDLLGYPAWYVNNTLFACLYDNGVAFRLERPIARERLREPGVEPFTPLGGKFSMAEWVQVFRERFGSSFADHVIWESAYSYALRRAGSVMAQDGSAL
ncbi:MAG: hypothetical protein HGB04_02380 [Chlorobiaceae bacterium]|nr:hypothetical protein [Chlorobiaceae bacterium]